MDRQETQLGPLRATRVRPNAPSEAPPLLLLHGIGLGAWVWERDQALWAEQGLESWAVDLPGHGADAGRDVGFQELEDSTLAALRELDGADVIGHSLGSLVAQRVALQCAPRSMVLVAALPPSEVLFQPTRAGVRQMLGRLPALAARRPLHFGIEAYLPAGLRLLPESDRAAVFSRIGPWPNRLVRELARRPSASPAPCPTLVTHGFKDQIASLWSARLLADYHRSVIWRFDDLAHFPMLEPGGERHALAVRDWLRRPHGRRVVEVDPLSPHEGVGQEAREARSSFRTRSNSRFGPR